MVKISHDSIFFLIPKNYYLDFYYLIENIILKNDLKFLYLEKMIPKLSLTKQVKKYQMNLLLS